MVASGSSNSTAQVRLKTRNSKSKQRTEAILEVQPAQTVEGQQNQLTDLVLEHFPQARLRVFHNGAVSFTTEELHIVAAYIDEVPVGIGAKTSEGDVDDDGFEQLPLTA